MRILNRWNGESVGVRAALCMAISSFFLLVGYEIIRSTSNSLYKVDWGVDTMPLALGLVPLFLPFPLKLYSYLLNTKGPRNSILISTVLSAIVILLCYLGIELKLEVASAALFIIREIYIVMIIEQMWAFVNSVINSAEAKYINGIILSFSTSGGILGGFFVHFTAEYLGTAHLVAIAALTCVPTYILAEKAYQMCPDVAPKEKKHQTSEKLSLDSFRKEKVLLVIMGTVFAAQVYGTIITQIFQKKLSIYYPQTDEQTAVSGLFFGVLHTVCLALQVFVAPILLRFVSVGWLHIGIPVVHAILLALGIFCDAFWPVGIALMMFKAVDYSIFRIIKEMLYIPLDYTSRFRAKAIIDVFVYRFSKGGAGLALTLLQSFISGFGVLIASGAVSLGIWITAVAPLRKRRD